MSEALSRSRMSCYVCGKSVIVYCPRNAEATLGLPDGILGVFKMRIFRAHRPKARAPLCDGSYGPATPPVTEQP